MAEGGDQDKTEEPTGKRLDDARSKGDVPKSPDLPQWASLAAVTGVILMSGGWLAQNLMADLVPFLAHPDSITLENNGGLEVARMAMRAAWPTFIAVMGSAAVAGIFANFVQTGFIWAPAKIQPDLSKVSLLKGLGRLFNIDSLVNFGKSLIKAVVIGVICWQTLAPHVSGLEQLATFEPARLMAFLMDVLKALFMSVLGALGVGAVLDWLWQRHRFMERQRMTREEVKEERRQSDGDPHIKGKQRQIRMQKAKQRMMANVPKATVVVANPTHFAVALRYGDDTPAPLCVAKGVDTLALKIRQVAEDAGVPVIEDPPLARALYAAVEIDQTIPHEHYAAVAKVIGFVMSAARRRRATAHR